MKTLKQLREEYDDQYVSQFESSEEMVLEAKSKSLMRPDIPSVSQMPSLLLFRRISYRLYPDKQVVALYYSKMVDKYLSVPFGPTGNLNLSEAVVYDTIEELEEGMAKTIAKTVGGGLVGAAQGAAKGFFKGAAVAADPGAAIGAAVGGVHGAYKGAKKAYEKSKNQDIKENFRDRLKEKRQERVDEVAFLAPLAGAALRGLGGWALSKGLEALTGSGKKDNKNTDDMPAQSKSASTELKYGKPKVKSVSTWKKTEDPVLQSKMKTADLKQLSMKENRIADLRNMINEGADNMSIGINGKTVTLNTSMAKRILEVYDSVNTKNKKIVESMLNEDLESFKKLLNFSIRK